MPKVKRITPSKHVLKLREIKGDIEKCKLLAGLDNAELAKAMNYDVQAIVRRMSDVGKIRLDELIAMSRILKFEVVFILPKVEINEGLKKEGDKYAV